MDVKCNETHKHTRAHQKIGCRELSGKRAVTAQNSSQSWTGRVVTQAQRPRTHRTLQGGRIRMQSWTLRGSRLYPDTAGHQRDQSPEVLGLAWEGFCCYTRV